MACEFINGLPSCKGQSLEPIYGPVQIGVAEFEYLNIKQMADGSFLSWVRFGGLHRKLIEPAQGGLSAEGKESRSFHVATVEKDDGFNGCGVGRKQLRQICRRNLGGGFASGSRSGRDGLGVRAEPE